MTKNKIGFSASNAGNGKTFTMLNKVKTDITSRYLIVNISKLMNQQTIDDWGSDSFKRIEVVDSSIDSEFSVLERIKQKIINSSCDLVITHRSLELLAIECRKDLSLLKYLGKMHLIVDEQMTPYNLYKGEMSNNDNVELLPNIINAHLAEENGTTFTLNEDHRQTIVDALDSDQLKHDYKMALTSMLDGAPCYIEQRVDKQLAHIMVFNPVFNLLEHFRRVTMLGAGIDRGDFFSIGKAWFDIDMYEDLHFKPEHATKYHNKQLTMMPIFEGKASKYKLEKKENQAKICEFIESTFGGEYIWASNKSIKKKLTLLGENIPVISHGLNKYQHIDQAAFIASMRMSLPEKKLVEFMCGERGGESIDIISTIENTRGCECAYQSIMRSSLRNRNSDKPVTVIVTDEYIAQYIKENYFPDAVIESPLISKKEQNKNLSKPRKSNKAAGTKEKVLALKSQGLTQKQVSEKLGISTKTCSRHWKVAA